MDKFLWIRIANLVILANGKWICKVSGEKGFWLINLICKKIDEDNPSSQGINLRSHCNISGTDYNSCSIGIFAAMGENKFKYVFL